MPKRYRIEMIIYDKSDTQLARDSQQEQYESDEQAKAKFEEKKQASHEAGKGSG
jgi:hypothetical protein